MGGVGGGVGQNKYISQQHMISHFNVNSPVNQHITCSAHKRTAQQKLCQVTQWGLPGKKQQTLEH